MLTGLALRRVLWMLDMEMRLFCGEAIDDYTRKDGGVRM